ncbi:peptidylprolyl isomerase [Nannocystis sp.]|uniref:peptidylprolyl isomerase n=1 Tax=Nannocystis sp. TaxID=1962667 RepID=UPI00242537AD|nr:peptidylprolyl isomerase [Nannocystis sp.]MBK7826271.1 peptidylprolyl isomerase [Nannocystis sp.]MBK9758216.1 peptidylprolyl isomerase [Nannocystis sp.]
MRHFDLLKSPVIVLLVALGCNSGPATSATETEGGSSGAGTTTDEPVDTTEASAELTSTDAPTTAEPTTDATAGETGETSGTSGDTGGADCSGDTPHVLLATTMGDMIVKLDAVNAPNTTANFLDYVESGFYDGTIFHRVAIDFVIQGGGFTPDLMEKPTNPPIPLEINPALTHVDGAIAMARMQAPDTAAAQFYLCDGPQPGLDGQYAVFGVLVDGFDVRDAIAEVPVGDENGLMDVPLEDVIIEMAYCVSQL